MANESRGRREFSVQILREGVLEIGFETGPLEVYQARGMRAQQEGDTDLVGKLVLCLQGGEGGVPSSWLYL